MRKTIGFFLFFVVVSLLANDNVHLTYHWHMHQPIYWPEKHPNLERVQFAAESLDIKLSGGNTYPGSTHAHPRNNLAGGDGEFDEVFSKNDRINAYQFGGKNSIGSILHHPNAGASVSYSGSLMENIRSFGKDNRLGYGGNWNQGYTEARRDWKTSGGHPRADMTGMTYHHAFSPLLPRSVLKKEIQLFKEIWWKSWDGNANKSDHSKGFWPVECAFSRHMIPILVEEGYEWSIVANSHLARTCENYLAVAQRGTSGWNDDPPNPADMINPAVNASQWYNGTRDARGGTFPAPFAYQAHKAKYVDPNTGQEIKMTIVPMCDYLSYENGFGSMGTGVIDAEIAPFSTDPNRPTLVLMAHDGDNAWGGGASYYQESVPNLMNEAAGKGYQPSTIQQFLDDHPVPDNAVVHIEDGAWVNAASDWGHPQFINWLWPPTRDRDDPDYDFNDPRTWFDIENGWAEDWRNWAVVIAGANNCETAEQIAAANGRPVNAWKIQEPVQPGGASNNPNQAELAWHYFLGGLDSGFMYYGTSLDDEVKQALAANRAIGHAQSAMSDNAGAVADQTPPSVFKPQRFPWNPGGAGWGPLVGYRPIGLDGNDPHYSDFYIWTLVHDVSGVQSVTLYVRPDNDGVNPINNNDNETYAGGSSVGAWASLPMTGRAIPKGNVTGNNTINFFIEPSEIADHYYAKVIGYNETLLDYYVEAVDSEGNVHRSDIQHVYVGQSNPDAPQPAMVTFSPNNSDNCPGAQVEVSYLPGNGPLSNAAPITVQASFDGGASFSPYLMTNAPNWRYTFNVPTGAAVLEVYFEGGGSLDNNQGPNYRTQISPCPIAPVVSFNPPAPDGCGDVTITYQPGTGILADADPVYIHIGHDGWQNVLDPAPMMTQVAPGTWEYTYTPIPGAELINLVFNNGEDLWDNNNEANYAVPVSNCVGPYDAAACLVGGTPLISTNPPGQNTIGETVDLAAYGGQLETTFQGGFGSFGQVMLNYDDTYLYLGGTGLNVSENRNGAVIFVGLDAMPNDVSNLWDLNGGPQSLDKLHNLAFTSPMDLAIVLGDEYGDGTFPSFGLGSGYDFGQGVFAFSATSFVEVAGAQLSQFDGFLDDLTTADDDDGNRETDRWEVAIPWASLNVSAVTNVQEVFVAGLILSDGESGVDRYISGNYLGAAASSDSGLDSFNNFGFSFVTLTPEVVCLPHMDGDNDGMRNEYELLYFNHPGTAEALADADRDGLNNRAESVTGTDPTDAASTFVIYDVADGVIAWSSVGGHTYTVEYTDDLDQAFVAIATMTENDVAEGVASGHTFTDDYNARPLTGPKRYYRVRVQ